MVKRLLLPLLWPCFAVASSHPLAPYAVSLTDATFEHETQASTGQTTGNWLVQFFTNGEIVIPSSGDSGDVIVSEEDWLESHVIVATVNLETNPLLKKRFAAHLVDSSSTWIYLHKRGVSKMAATTNVSWEDLKKFSESPGTVYTIPPPPLAQPSFHFAEFIHQNAGTFGLLCGIVGIRIIVWLVRNYAGENAHRRVIIGQKKKRQ